MFPFGMYGGLRDLTHDRELAGRLGDMVIAWSNAENALVNVFHIITNVSWAMAAAGYYRIPSFEARTKTMRAMLCEWNTDVYNPGAIHRAVLKLNALSKFRNDLVHGNWAQAQGSGETVIFDYRELPDAAKRCRPVKAVDIKNHVEAVHLRTDQLLALVPFSGPPQVLS
jgi:hypothetical protein